MKNIIVAYDKNRAIGNEGDLLWQHGEMRDDMKHFRELTKDTVIVMGRKTLESIGIALPNRQNIVLTSAESVPVENIEIAHSLDEVDNIADDNKEIFYIGGGEIYRQALAEVEKIYATEVDASVLPADTFFPELDNDWKVTDEAKHPADDRNIYPYTFKTYERNK